MGGFNWTVSDLGKLLPKRHGVGVQMVTVNQWRGGGIWMGDFMKEVQNRTGVMVVTTLMRLCIHSAYL